MKNGFTMFGDVLDSEIKGVIRANNAPYIELGTINSDLSLTTDSFPIPIPKGDYMVNIAYTNNAGVKVKEAGTHSHSVNISHAHTYNIYNGTIDGYNGTVTSGQAGTHTHNVTATTLTAGDRVVVARVGTERIVLAIIVSSNML